MNLLLDNLFLSSIFSYIEFSYQPALKASLFFLSTNLSKQPRTLFKFLYFFSIFFTKGSNDTFIQRAVNLLVLLPQDHFVCTLANVSVLIIRSWRTRWKLLSYICVYIYIYIIFRKLIFSYQILYAKARFNVLNRLI